MVPAVLYVLTVFPKRKGESASTISGTLENCGGQPVLFTQGGQGQKIIVGYLSNFSPAASEFFYLPPRKTPVYKCNVVQRTASAGKLSVGLTPRSAKDPGGNPFV